MPSITAHQEWLAPLRWSRGVSQLAARAVKGGVLSMGELLMVAGALRNFQNLVSWYGSSEHDALPTDDLFYALAPQPGLEQQISSAILAPDAMQIRHRTP